MDLRIKNPQNLMYIKIDDVMEIQKKFMLLQCKYCRMKHNTLLQHKETSIEHYQPPLLQYKIAPTSDIV